MRKYHERALDTFVSEPFRAIDWQLQGMTLTDDKVWGTAEEWTALINRVRAIPRYLNSAQAQLLIGVKANHVPDRRMLERDGLATSEANDKFFAETLPALVSAHPGVYHGMGLRDLADQMFGQLKASRQTYWLAEAFSTLPRPMLSPRDAYQRLIRSHIEQVPLEELANRILATSVVPYPPGIPMLMPGETTGPMDGPHLSYLRALASWDERFPGFGHDTHGISNRNGTYWVQCVKGMFHETSRTHTDRHPELVGGAA